MSQRSVTSIKLGRREVRVSNPDKILYPQPKFTKGQVLEYYRQIAPVILHYLKGRPLTLKRYPNGVDAPFFYEKNCPDHRPDWIKTILVTGKTGKTNYCTVDHAAGLLWVANLASIELHTLLAKVPNLDRPTMMVFDLDPGPPAGLLECLPIAVQFHDMLRDLGLESFAKTSGGKGLHIYVPLNTPVTFDQTKSFSRAMAGLLERSIPDRVTTLMRKDLRTGKIFVDWSQNDDHKTTVCAYSMRARTQPTVSTPVTWEEIAKAIKRKDASKLVFEAPDVIKRVDKLGDLFEPVLKLKQRLPAVG
jgi:bifunctional non-homologous end joining protein LigD